MKLQDTKILIHIINTEDVHIETLKIKKEELGDEIEKAVGGFFTSAGRFESGDTLYVNDNGANDPAMADYMFTVPHYMAPLYGNGVVVGSTPYGDEQSATTDWDWLLWNVKLVREWVPKLNRVVRATPFAHKMPTDKIEGKRVRVITDHAEIMSAI